MDTTLWYQFFILVGVSLFLFVISPLSKNVEGFFGGKDATNTPPNMMMLTSSLVISWIFAKSITNAANLGQSFGIVGGISYGVYYFSFFVAGMILYQLRVQGKFTSIHDFLRKKFGKSAIAVFSLLIGIRLLNEVWSNTAVIGQYFGDYGSQAYIWSIVLFTLLTLIYSLKGGLRSSILTDVIQMFLFGILLAVVLALILPTQSEPLSLFTQGTWRWDMGVNLLLVAGIQIFSYPFHDPVMTDRGFLSDPKTTLKSFFLAGIIGFIIIVLFSLVGVYAGQLGLEGDASVMVSRTFGVGAMLLMNCIMLTSAASTLDSTFSSSAKLATIDLFPAKKVTVRWGRMVMIGTTVVGLLPLLFAPEIISATTVSGTMVLGLAPVFLLWKWKAPLVSFHASVWIGIMAGILLVFEMIPEEFFFTTGKYADLLTVNIYATIACFLAYLMPVVWKSISPKSSEV